MYKSLRRETAIQISLIAAKEIETKTIYPANYLVRAYGLESTGRLWHDNPEGEYLTMGKIPRAAILGTIEFHDVTQPVKLLLPELAIIGDDRPNQRMRALRRDCFYFKEPAAADDAVEDICLERTGLLRKNATRRPIKSQICSTIEMRSFH